MERPMDALDNLVLEARARGNPQGDIGAAELQRVREELEARRAADEGPAVATGGPEAMVHLSEQWVVIGPDVAEDDVVGLYFRDTQVPDTGDLDRVLKLFAESDQMTMDGLLPKAYEELRRLRDLMAFDGPESDDYRAGFRAGRFSVNSGHRAQGAAI